MTKETTRTTLDRNPDVNLDKEPIPEGPCSAEVVAAVRHACHHLLREAERCRQKAVKYEHDGRPRTATPWHNKAAAFSMTVKALEVLLPNE